MNELIKKQLANVKTADLSNYNEATHTYIIPKFNQVKLNENDCYLIKLDNSLLFRGSNTILESNWNKGTVPPCQYLKVDVSKIVGKMICVTGIGYNINTQEDTNDIWTGWLPLQQIEVISKL